MEIYHVDLAPPEDTRPAVLSIGKFDGVHVGHQKILRTARRIKTAEERFSVISFSPHPLYALHGLEAYREMLTPGAEKAYWLAHYGVDSLIETAFTASYAETSPEIFVHEHLTNLQLRHIIVGEEFNFGKGRDSDVELLRSLCAPYGIEVTAVPIEKEQTREKVSSTVIRALIREGRIQEAEHFLGHPFFVRGVVKAGLMTGLEDVVLPQAGSYLSDAGLVEILPDKEIKMDLPDGPARISFQ
ncbi:FAD synthetase family protein [Listeria costaricensis]|uniref:FAD synthetase family protein n=1 Tax=Listeria costaricensis TaxID=2026604 RepID=UPI000C085CAA|nr:FAD synthetase family protein [Listeria costaricensis]